MKFRLALLCSLGLLAATQASACYTVYDQHNRVLYQGLDSPVDMTLHVKDALRQRYPAGAHMVFDQSNRCAATTIAQVQRTSVGAVPENSIRMERSGATQPVRSGPSSPLLTDRRTAAQLGLPHQQVAGNIVVVPAQAATSVRYPAMTVIPSEMMAQAEPGVNTSVLGAGPAPARALPQRGTVITEMRDPPMTVIERGSDRVIRRR